VLSFGFVAALGLILFGLSSLVSTLGQEDLERVHALQGYVRSHTDFRPRVEAFDALMRSSSANIKSLMPWYWSTPYNVWLAGLSWQAFAPGFVWLLYYGVRSVVRLPVRRLVRGGLLALFLAASISPLLLNFVGWDWNRWNGLALLGCFGALVALRLYFPGTERSPATRLWAFGVSVVCIGLASTTPLFDEMETQFFPFDAHRTFLKELIEKDFTYRPRY
jgi:hypothetical protein